MFKYVIKRNPDLFDNIPFCLSQYTLHPLQTMINFALRPLSNITYHFQTSNETKIAWVNVIHCIRYTPQQLMLNNIEIKTYHWSRTAFKFTLSPLSNINQSLDHCIHRLKCKWCSWKIRLYNLGPNNCKTVAVSQWTLRVSSALSAPGPKWSRSITCTAHVQKWLKCHPGIHVTDDAT